MKVKVISALLFLVTLFGANAANANPYFGYNLGYPAPGMRPFAMQPPCISYYPPPYYRYHRHWHRHWFS